MQKKSYFAGILVIFSSWTMSCFADETDYQQKHQAECGKYYVQQSIPQDLSKKSNNTYYLCFEGFAVGFSAKGKIALWSAEHLTAERLAQAEMLERKDSFHVESKLPTQFQATLKDYKNVPFDRGHLAPNADMPSLEAQYDSFSLANIIPQNPTHNRGIWRSIETRTRYLALKHQEIYVVTGTAFLDKKLQVINQNILVPTHLYKAIYIPSLNQAGVYFSPNNASGLVEVISLNELAVRIGRDVMPALDMSVQSHTYALPTEHLALNEETPNDSTTSTQEGSKLLDFLKALSFTLLQWLVSLLQR